MRSERLIPVTLSHNETIVRCLVDEQPATKPQVAVGKLITLDDPEIDPEIQWEVVSMGVPINRYAINRGWNNNI